MSTTEERVRSVVQAGALLLEVALDKRLPVEVRRDAVRLVRHYPTVSSLSLVFGGSVISCKEAVLAIDPEWTSSYAHGPLTESKSDRVSRLAFTLDDGGHG